MKGRADVSMESSIRLSTKGEFSWELNEMDCLVECRSVKCGEKNTTIGVVCVQAAWNIWIFLRCMITCESIVVIVNLGGVQTQVSAEHVCEEMSCVASESR